MSLAGVCLLSPAASLTGQGGCKQSAIAADQTVTASGFSFTPSNVTLAQGEKVTWNNTSGFHNVHFDDNSFVQPPTAQSAPWTVSRNFTTPGTFRYYCDAHGGPGGVGMSGTVTVNYSQPVGASPMRLPLVPAFQACGSPDSTHGAPLNFPSCEPPVPVSGTVQSGTGSIGYANILVCNVGAAPPGCKESAPGFTTAMQPDVRLFGTGRNIQCRLTGTPAGCTSGQDYNPNGAAGPYTTVCGSAASCSVQRPAPFCAPGAGSAAACSAGADITATAALGQPGALTVNPTAQCGSNPTCLAFASKFVGNGLRVTDRYNCDPSLPAGDPNACPASTSTSTRPATLVDIQFPMPVDCVANPAGGATGANCGVNTTANAIVPAAVIAGKAAVIELGEIQVLDSGADGARGNADDQRFATQGIFLP